MNPRLSPMQNKIVDLLRQGLSRAEIAERCGISVSYLSTSICRARQRGEPIPMGKSGPPRRSNDRLLEIREQVRREQVRRDVYGAVAERAGMSLSAVRARLWRHDRRQKGASR